MSQLEQSTRPSSRRASVKALRALAWKRTAGRMLGWFTVFLALALGFVLAALGSRLARGLAYESLAGLGAAPLVAAKACLWGPGFVAVVLASLRAWPRDDADGIWQLVRRQGHAAHEWVGARRFALVRLVALAQLLTVLPVLLVPLATSPSRITLHTLLQGALPAAVFALAGTLVLVVIGIACLGPRSRPGGYALLAAVLFLPELLAPWTGPWLGADCTSVPAMLGGLANACQTEHFDPARALRSLAGLFAVAAACHAATRVSLRSPGLWRRTGAEVSW